MSLQAALKRVMNEYESKTKETLALSIRSEVIHLFEYLKGYHVYFYIVNKDHLLINIVKNNGLLILSFKEGNVDFDYTFNLNLLCMEGKGYIGKDYDGIQAVLNLLD